jgi:hypothetical protein
VVFFWASHPISWEKMPYKRNDAVADRDKVDLGGTVSNSTMTIRHRGQSVKGNELMSGA